MNTTIGNEQGRDARFWLRVSVCNRLAFRKYSYDDRYVMYDGRWPLFWPRSDYWLLRGDVRFLAAVADGVSATQDREAIADFAVRRLVRLFDEKIPPETWLQTVNDVASALYLDPEANIPMPSGATTLSLLAFEGGRVFSANVGDSPILRIRDGKATAMYAPHSEYAQPPLAVWNGTGEGYGALTNFIGNPYYRKTQESGQWWSVRVGDVYVVCSDGAARAVTLPRLLRFLATEKHPSAQKLLFEYTGQVVDDSTLILIQVLPASGLPCGFDNLWQRIKQCGYPFR